MNHDGTITAQELKAAQQMPWLAEALSHLVVRCESEWGGGPGKWEDPQSADEGTAVAVEGRTRADFEAAMVGTTHGSRKFPQGADAIAFSSGWADRKFLG